MRFRLASAGDAAAVAGLHLDSWRRHYRGAFADDFLDRDVSEYLLPLWTERLAVPDPGARTILADHDGVVPAPGGDPGRLAGTPVSLRFAWRDLTELSR